MIREIKAKVLLSRVKQPDDWFGGSCHCEERA